MDRYFDDYTFTEELTHHGVKGMRWGVRRYQPYPDGKSGKFLGKKKNKQRKSLKAVIKRSRADRAREDVKFGKKLAKKYVSSLEKKAKKRADRAREDVDLGKKLAKKYVGALEKKAEKRETLARAGLIPEKRKPYGPHTELNPNTSKPAKRMRDKILERSKVENPNTRETAKRRKDNILVLPESILKAKEKREKRKAKKERIDRLISYTRKKKK